MSGDCDLVTRGDNPDILSPVTRAGADPQLTNMS